MTGSTKLADTGNYWNRRLAVDSISGLDRRSWRAVNPYGHTAVMEQGTIYQTVFCFNRVPLVES